MTFDLCRKLRLLRKLSELCIVHESLADSPILNKGIDVTKEFSDLFSRTGLLCTGVEYSISIDKQATPFSQPARRFPPAIMPKVKAALDQMVADGVIRSIEEPTPFCSPMVVAYQKNRDVRIVTDLRKLNQCVQREEFQIPTRDELVFKAKRATVFSQCNLKSGFWHIPVTKESQKSFLAFSTPFGRFCYQKLPMELSASPDVFSRILHKVLEGLDKVLIYIDDIVVAMETIEEHTIVLWSVLQCLWQTGLKLNREKCSFFKSKIKFMGHIWDAEEVRNCPEKIDAIQQMPTLTDRQSLRSFLGLAGNIGQRHILHYGSMVKPLWEMLQKNTPFEWTESRLQTYERVREALCGGNALAYFDANKPVIVHTDASGHGVGAAILQDGKPCVFALRKLTSTESRYSQIEREFLAIVFGLSRLKNYLIGVRFVLMTDHKPIVQLFNRPIDALSNRLQRWLVAIQHFDFEIKHIKSTSNVVADGLSRNPMLGHPTELETAKYTLCFLLKILLIDLQQVAEATGTDNYLWAIVEAI